MQLSHDIGRGVEALGHLACDGREPLLIENERVTEIGNGLGARKADQAKGVDGQRTVELHFELPWCRAWLPLKGVDVEIIPCLFPERNDLRRSGYIAIQLVGHMT